MRQFNLRVTTFFVVVATVFLVARAEQCTNDKQLN